MEKLGDTRLAAVFRIEGTRVTELTLHWEWRQTLVDLGLEE
jgi:hypothetical protein